MLKKLLKNIKCKLFMCCQSKCSLELNDTDNNGIPDEAIIKQI